MYLYSLAAKTEHKKIILFNLKHFLVSLGILLWVPRIQLLIIRGLKQFPLHLVTYISIRNIRDNYEWLQYITEALEVGWLFQDCIIQWLSIDSSSFIFNLCLPQHVSYHSHGYKVTIVAPGSLIPCRKLLVPLLTARKPLPEYFIQDLTLD